MARECLPPPCRDMRPAAQSLFFACPKKRNQKKGPPDGCAAAAQRFPALLAPGGKLANSPLRGSNMRASLSARRCAARLAIRDPKKADCALLPYAALRSAEPWGCAAARGAERACLSPAGASLRASPKDRAPQGTPRAARGVASGAAFFAYFLCRSKESRSPCRGETRRISFDCQAVPRAKAHQTSPC